MQSKTLALAASGAAMVAAVAAVAADGATVHPHATVSGTVHIYVTQQGSHPTLDILVGAITDHGTDKSDPHNRNFQKVVLTQGSFEVDTSKFNRGFKPVPTGGGCSQAGTTRASARVFNGTGAYAGIAGTLQLTGTYAAVGKVVNGKCTVNNKPIAGSFTVQGVGHVAY